MKERMFLMVIGILLASCQKQELIYESGDLNIEINAGEEYLHKYNIAAGINIKNPPQFVFWIEDTDGNYLNTLLCTYRAATGKWRASKGEDKNNIHRESALPYWSHQRNIQSQAIDIDALSSATIPSAYYMPCIENPLVDGITCATPNETSQFKMRAAEQLTQFKLFAEFNQSTDFNEYFPSSAIKGEDNYSGGEQGSGQPSLVYATTIDLQNANKEYNLKLIGHGSPDGSSDTLIIDLSKITSAKHIIESVKINIK
jgi:hypothetical protein